MASRTDERPRLRASTPQGLLVVCAPERVTTWARMHAEIWTIWGRILR